MKIALFAAFAFAFMGSALGVIHCAPTSYQAISLDTINFRFYHAILDHLSGRSMYESLTDDEIRVFDEVTEELFERYANGSCVRFKNTRGQLDPAYVAETFMLVEPSFEVNLGNVEMVGYEADLGHYKTKIILDKKDCNPHYIEAHGGGKPLLANVNSGIRSISTEDRQKVADALAELRASNCPIEHL